VFLVLPGGFLTAKSADSFRPKRAPDLYVDLGRSSGYSEQDVEELRSCHSKNFRRVDCLDENQHVDNHRMFVPVGCSNRRCPVCTNSRVVREVDYQIVKIKSWYNAYGVDDAVHYGTVDFTLPKDLQMRVNELNRDLLVGEAYASFAELRGGLSPDASASHVRRDSEYFLAGYVNFQDWSSEEPLTGGYYPHIHSTWLGLRFHGDFASSMSMYLSPSELKRLKEIWTRRAQALLGQSSYRKTFDLFVHYGDSYRDLRKRLQYQMRYASKDVARICRDGFYWHCVTAKQAECYKKAGMAVGFKKGRWWLRTELEVSKVDKMEFLRLTERPKRKYVNPVGWINPRCLKKFEALLGISFVRRVVLMKELCRIHCPMLVRREGRLVRCGCQLEYSSFSSGYASLEGIRAVNGVILVHEKPETVVLKVFDDKPFRR